jgi:cation transport ATPase
LARAPWSVIARLSELGIKNSITPTGDNDTVARAATRRLGRASHIADMMPADKADAILELRWKGNIVAMVGRWRQRLARANFTPAPKPLAVAR